MTDIPEPYQPEFDNPYPDQPWKRISDFVYEVPLRLYRHDKAITMGGADEEGKDALYLVEAPYTVSFLVDGVRQTVTVPAGMVTDLASVPWFARWLVGRVGPHLEASIVHDFLYIAWQDLDRRGARKEDWKFADHVLRAGMRKVDLRLGGFRRTLIFLAVHSWFGWSVYKGRDQTRYRKIPPPPAV
jgi:hypothetical protein